jgi:5,6-dimethylbenzimidazole synthase
MNTDPSAAPYFDEAFRARLQDLFCWRRDVRRFRTDPLPPGSLERLIEVACQAPSVGLCQKARASLPLDAIRRPRDTPL